MKISALLFFVICNLFSCSGKISDHLNQPDESSDHFEELCGEPLLVYDRPVLPLETNVAEVAKYSGEIKGCLKVPDVKDGQILMKEGCYEGCIAAEGIIEVTGAGSEKTLIICNDKEKDGVITVGKQATVYVKDLSLNGNTRGIFSGSGSRLTLENVAIYNVFKGGINVCGDEDICDSEVFVSSALITDIKTDESKISYGISMGSGDIYIKDSILKGFNSFGISFWGTSDNRVKGVIENSIISEVSGGSRVFEGHGIYGENNVDLSISQSLISKCSSTFIFITGEEGIRSVKMRDVTADTTVNEEKEQGGMVFDKRTDISMHRVIIKNSRGNGLFLKDSDIKGEDITIESVSHDGLGQSGFGILLFDKGNSFFNRISIKDSAIAGILIDGENRTQIKNFNISGTKPEENTLEYGIGIAVQDGAELSLEKGIVEKNRECGIMVINGNIQLKDVLIKNTLPRKCQEKNMCQFAPGIPFGHGLSLYNNSKMVFNGIYIEGNNNGMNLESSEVLKMEGGKALFLNNVNAVNAWNLKNYFVLEDNLENASFCGNDSVFTTDMQPVRDQL